jgi:GGDEF domain.
MAIFPDYASQLESIVKTANIALYQAKNEGRNRVVMSAQKSASA